MILAIDTSTALTSISLADGSVVLAQLSHLDARKHAEVLAPMLRDVLAASGASPADVLAVAVGVGPGPYTGLRVGIATARALGAAWDVPVHGLCSLDAIAAAECAMSPTSGFGVASDARRREVYWAWYDADGTRREGPLVGMPADIEVERRSGRWLGAGAHAHADSFGSVEASLDDELLYPHASWVARRVGALLAADGVVRVAEAPLSAHGDDGAGTSALLLGADLLPPRPLYLRRPDATPRLMS